MSWTTETVSERMKEALDQMRKKAQAEETPLEPSEYTFGWLSFEHREEFNEKMEKAVEETDQIRAYRLMASACDDGAKTALWEAARRLKELGHEEAAKIVHYWGDRA